ncbi:prolyl oligopeptidase family serine peptidase [bacterium]|nr:prolyl oligopeptidase family serine peptidase [bacterium]
MHVPDGAAGDLIHEAAIRFHPIGITQYPFVAQGDDNGLAAVAPVRPGAHRECHRLAGHAHEPTQHVAALKKLAADGPWMDLGRVGVHGKSWGGYFTLRALLQAPEFYKVGVASASPVDLATTAESAVVPYMGLPEDAAEAYGIADCLPLADRLQGDMLLTIGTSDRNTPFGQSMRMLDAFQAAGKDMDLVVFPGENHWLQGASYERWKRALREYFLEHLPPDPR